MPEARLRPLRVRPGTRYACQGDGLCCTDAHVLGPVSREEAARANAVVKRATERHGKLDMVALRIVDHACVFLDADGCRLHRDHGAAYKPATCRHFPLGVVATPTGGRVVTDHRCPCRTMGDRPLLDAAAARASLTEGGARLSPLGRATKTVALSRSRRVPFARYEALEAAMLERLRCGEPPESVLAHEAFPPLDGLIWGDVAHHLRAMLDGSAGGDALAWGGDAILALFAMARPQLRARPWSPAFDRAEARSSPGDAEAIFADFVADELWSLAWMVESPFDVACASIATRLAIARWVWRRLLGAGVRADRAAAEAVLVAELCGRASLWGSVIASIELPVRGDRGARRSAHR